MDLRTINYEEERYKTFMGRGGKKLIHWEHWSCPDAETYLTGIDYYEHPKLCRERLGELYPMLQLGIPKTDERKKRPQLGTEGLTSNSDTHTVRWGDGETATFLHGEAYFKTPEEVFAFSPLEHADFRSWAHVVENHDFSSEEKIYEKFRKNYPAEWGDTAPAGSAASAGFYNTTFMWPLLTFGWELFLECSLDERFERVMDEFAEINRRVFRAIARLPVNFVVCHDDIVMTRGPVCSPQWMHRYVFPRYEEYWSLLKSTGKEVIFMVDGCVDAYADDVFACGARGIISEPYTNYKAIARKHKDCFIAGEGDNRILNRNNPEEIRAMVESMAETGKMSGGYMMCIGNHIPWNVNPEGIKRYLDLCNEIGYR
ncbi:MAG: hypothetical protein LBB77_08070 [Treponema sp.]|nr:hypothetical protein [Treponema sp.]